MAIDEAEFKQRKRQAEAARQDRDKKAGLLEGVMERLESTFKVKTIKAAEELSKTLTAEADTAEATYDEAAAAFDEAWTKYQSDDE